MTLLAASLAHLVLGEACRSVYPACSPVPKSTVVSERARRRGDRWLGGGLRLTKIRKFIGGHGVEIAYPALHRLAVSELQFWNTATTIQLAAVDKAFYSIPLQTRDGVWARHVSG